MKYFAILSLSLLFIACSGQLENADVETNVLSESGILNTVNIGDSWDDVKLLAGEYWEVREDKASNIYQFRKDINLSGEHMFVSFLLEDNKVAGLGFYIVSKNITEVAMTIFSVDVFAIYKGRFGIDLGIEGGDDYVYNDRNYHYSMNKSFDSENAPGFSILCF